MKLFVGLGNHGDEYENTRHNVGFLVVDELAKRERASWKMKKELKALVAEAGSGDTRVILLKPQTYMNLSGESVQAALAFWKLTPDDLVVVFDDADLPFGELRVRESGSSGGHNGIKSIIERIGTDAFARVKVGIGRSENPNVPLDEWVLSRFNAEETKMLPDLITQAADRVHTVAGV